MIDLEKYKAIPYRDHGRDFSGADCWGLVWLVYRDLGVDLPSWSAEYELAHDVDKKSIGHCFSGWREVAKPEPFDVAVFEVSGNFHVGLCLDGKGREMMHTIKGRNVSVEKIQSMLWRNCFRGFYHYDR